jgi:hypothetical protein
LWWTPTSSGRSRLGMEQGSQSRDRKACCEGVFGGSQ